MTARKKGQNSDVQQTDETGAAAAVAAAVEHQRQTAVAEHRQAAAAEYQRQTAAAEHHRQTQGQRRVNLIWECTQAVIAILVTGSVIYSAVNGIDSLLLGNAFVMILAMYFIRTNHVTVGGVPSSSERKPEPPHR